MFKKKNWSKNWKIHLIMKVGQYPGFKKRKRRPKIKSMAWWKNFWLARNGPWRKCVKLRVNLVSLKLKCISGVGTKNVNSLVFQMFRIVLVFSSRKCKIFNVRSKISWRQTLVTIHFLTCFKKTTSFLRKVNPPCLHNRCLTSKILKSVNEILTNPAKINKYLAHLLKGYH